MKALLVAISIWGLAAVVKGDEPHDPYQEVAPDLVKKVELAKTKQDSSDPRQRDEAESLLREVIKSKPDYYRALYNLGLTYLAKNEPDKAVDVLAKAKVIRDKKNLPDPDSAILNSLGWAYLNAGDLKNAEANLKLAYDKKNQNEAPTNERVLNNLGYLYLQEGKTTEARKFLEESKVRYHSDRANSILNLVNEYERQQNQSQTVTQLWALYGQQPKAGGAWTERYFDEVGKDKQATPRTGDWVAAVQKVYARSAPPVWDDSSNEFVYGTIVGYIYPGERVNVLEVLDNNAQNAKNKNAWYWIRVNRLAKK